MALTQADYHRQLKALLPPGRVLPEDADSNWQKLMLALSGLFDRVDARAAALLDEIDPRTAEEMLTDWERVTGMPDPCVTGDQTIAERRAAVMRVLTSTGGQSRAYFIEMAAALGYTITIEEHRPQTVGDAVDYPVNGADWQYAWTVNAQEETVSYLTVTSDVSEALASWGNERLECVIKRYKPAQTYVLFAYGSN